LGKGIFMIENDSKIKSINVVDGWYMMDGIRWISEKKGKEEI
jgi:hypothetical protein